MESTSSKSAISRLPLALLTTFAVVVLPCVLALGLRAWDLVTSPVLLILLPVAFSLAISQGLAFYWKRRKASSQYMFEDLMIWGWVRSWRFERLLARADTFVGPNAESGLSVEQRARKLERLSAALDARDPHTHGHSRRVARHVARVAKRLKLPPEEIARIRTAALLHDVGKIETPREIMEKPDKLTDSEYEVIKLHPGAGAKMVAELNDPELTSIVLHHHERIDGDGYPDGIAGDEILLGARIIAVADTFDALTSARPYRPAKSHEFAIAILREEAGVQLDAAVVAAFDSRYAGHRPVAVCAAALGASRQLGQTLITAGSGASQVAAVGAAVAVIGAAPAQKPPPDPVPGNQPNLSKAAPSDSATTPGPATTAADANGQAGSQPNTERKDGSKPNSSDGGGGDAGNGSNGGGSGGGGGGSGGGSGGGGGGSTPSTPAEDPITPVTDATQGAINNLPEVPEQVPAAPSVNDAVQGVKGIPGNLTKP